MGDFEEWADYNFMWTQWKSNKIVEGLKPYKDFLALKEKETDNSLASTFATDKESGSSTENLITTPKRQITKSSALQK